MGKKIIKITPRRFLKEVYRVVNKSVVNKPREKDKYILKLKKKIDFSGCVITVGNHSFIDLVLDGADPEDLSDGILHLLDYFEKVNNFKIVNWFIEKRQRGRKVINDIAMAKTDIFISGIWITHQRAK